MADPLQEFVERGGGAQQAVDRETARHEQEQAIIEALRAVNRNVVGLRELASNPPLAVLMIQGEQLLLGWSPSVFEALKTNPQMRRLIVETLRLHADGIESGETDRRMAEQSKHFTGAAS